MNTWESSRLELSTRTVNPGKPSPATSEDATWNMILDAVGEEVSCSGDRLSSPPLTAAATLGGEEFLLEAVGDTLSEEVGLRDSGVSQGLKRLARGPRFSGGLGYSGFKFFASILTACLVNGESGVKRLAAAAVPLSNGRCRGV